MDKIIYAQCYKYVEGNKIERQNKNDRVLQARKKNWLCIHNHLI